MESKPHWESIYQQKAPTEVSWYQKRSRKSLELIKATAVDKDGSILDVGGGASTLVDHLLEEGYRQITVLDVSAKALAAAKARLGARAKKVSWIEEDVTQISVPESFYDLWHDRAAFHFLTDARDRNRYVDAVRRALKPKGHLIMATFALEGPPRCSGLEVVRYSPESRSTEFGPEFRLVQSVAETHHTPFSTEQKFIYSLFRKS